MICWSQTDFNTFKNGLLNNKFRLSSPLLTPGFGKYILDEVARNRDDLWPIVQENLSGLNKFGREQLFFWLICGYHQDKKCTDKRFEFIKLIDEFDLFAKIDSRFGLNDDISCFAELIVFKGFNELFEFYFEKNKNLFINYKNEFNGNNLLHLAFLVKNDFIARTLIDNGVCLNSKNNKGETPEIYLKNSLIDKKLSFLPKDMFESKIRPILSPAAQNEIKSIVERFLLTLSLKDMTKQKTNKKNKKRI
jgi:hypothetical protein